METKIRLSEEAINGEIMIIKDKSVLDVDDEGLEMESSNLQTDKTVGTETSAFTQKSVIHPSDYAPVFQSDFLPPKKRSKRQLTEPPSDEIIFEKFVPVITEEEDDLYTQMAEIPYKKRSVDFVYETIIKEKPEKTETRVKSFIARLDQHEPSSTQALPEVDASKVSVIDARLDASGAKPSELDASKASGAKVGGSEGASLINSDTVKLDVGLSSALKFFQARNAFQKPTEATITHKDEFGRILSEKEAYKQHSWKFHGVKPKAKKTEKRILKIENEIKATHANI